MLVLVNGQAREFSDGETVADVLSEVDGVPPSGVAVAVDGEVVPRRAWADTGLRDGSRVEVVVAVQGG
jgi:sulfur carrier protein